MIAIKRTGHSGLDKTRRSDVGSILAGSRSSLEDTNPCRSGWPDMWGRVLFCGHIPTSNSHC